MSDSRSVKVMGWEVVLYGLAAFRLAVLLSLDTGPMKMFAKLRWFLKREAKHHPALKKSDVAAGISCLRCSSVWVALPVAAYAYYHDQLAGWFAITGDIFLLAMALSSITILFNRAFPPK